MQNLLGLYIGENSLTAFHLEELLGAVLKRDSNRSEQLVKDI